MSKALPATDLSSAFAAPGTRAAGLRLPPRKAPPSPSVAPQRAVEPVPDPEPAKELDGSQEAENAATQAPKTKPGKPSGGRTRSTTPKSPTKRTPSAPTDTPKASPRKTPPATVRNSSEPGRLVLWTTVAIRSRMKTLQAETDRVYRDQVLDALEATHAQLPELIARAGAPTTTVQGALFERVETNNTAVHEERKQLTIRSFLESQLDVIDKLVETTGANSRSALVNAALDAYLPKPS